MIPLGIASKVLAPLMLMVLAHSMTFIPEQTTAPLGVLMGGIFVLLRPQQTVAPLLANSEF